MKKISRKLKPLLTLSFCALFIFIGVVTVHATMYYVATTGSDSNNGLLIGTPFHTIQKAVNSVKAGDTVLVADGTYTDTDGNGIVVYVSGSSAQGTASAPITIKSTNPLGAKITIPSNAPLNQANVAFYITRDYYIIEGFDISGGAQAGSVSHTGIVFNGSTGSIARNNVLHNIARTLCTDSDFGNTGMFLDSTNGVSLNNNTFHAIGRLRNGEQGCVTTHYQHDHGIYVKASTNTTIHHNIIYDTNRGFPIHVFGGAVTNLNIYNNTLVGKSPTGLPVGQIMLASTITTANIKNNISCNAQIGMITQYSLAASGVLASHNLSDTLETTGAYAGVTYSNNLQNTSPGFVDAAVNDFHLKTGSAAIDAGTYVGIQVQDGAIDIGAYEFGTSSATLASPQNLRVQ
jgi:hypothetical protein